MTYYNFLYCCSFDSKQNKASIYMNDIYKIPSHVLLCIGGFDLLRGFMHTFVLNWSAAHFAKFDMGTVPEDQLFLLGVFGISNFLTGTLFILISQKARHLSPYVLISIPLIYLLGLAGIWSGGIHAQAQFNGRYFLFLYFFICIVTFIHFIVRKRQLSLD